MVFAIEARLQCGKLRAEFESCATWRSEEVRHGALR
jgi:hypothetical protein